MKCILIGTQHHDLLPTLESFLKHWGYRVLFSSAEKPFLALLETLHPDMALMDHGFLSRLAPESVSLLTTAVHERSLEVAVLLDESEAASDLPESLNIRRLLLPLDIFELYRLTQKVLQAHPRQRLRLDVKLPGMFAIGEGPTQIGEILTVSEGGMFLKTGLPLDAGAMLKVFFPLMGMNRELELSARVLYPIKPTQKNRYLQGVGLEFVAMTDKEHDDLKIYLENTFIERVVEAASIGDGPDPDQVRRQPRNDDAPSLH